MSENDDTPTKRLMRRQLAEMPALRELPIRQRMEAMLRIMAEMMLAMSEESGKPLTVEQQAMVQRTLGGSGAKH